MKLPDFTNYEPFDRLRELMGASLITWDSPQWVRESLEDVLTKLLGEGLDVGYDDVAVDSDGLFVFAENRVLLYIRDISNYGSTPKFHITTCHTILHYRDTGKYVASMRTDGIFVVHYSDGWSNTVYKDERRLFVCKNCMQILRYKGYTHQSGAKLYREFSLEEFFSMYPVSPHRWTPGQTSVDAPMNHYTKDWFVVSNRERAKANWTCSVCLTRFIQNDTKKYLHVHHINGNKADNDPSNLRPICIGCHSRQPNHSHLKGHKDWHAFSEIYPHLADKQDIFE